MCVCNTARGVQQLARESIILKCWSYTNLNIGEKVHHTFLFSAQEK